MLREIVEKVNAFTSEAHGILSVHEAAVSRIVLLEDSYKHLATLSLKQDELIRQALRCIEQSLFRAAHVMAWAGFMDFLEEKLASDSFVKLNQVRPKWGFSTIEQLREEVPEFQLIDAARDLDLCSKNEAKALHGLLNKRNECAHPSDYFPELNESLGYVSELLQRIKTLQGKSL